MCTAIFRMRIQLFSFPFYEQQFGKKWLCLNTNCKELLCISFWCICYQNEQHTELPQVNSNGGINVNNFNFVRLFINDVFERQLSYIIANCRRRGSSIIIIQLFIYNGLVYFQNKGLKAFRRLSLFKFLAIFRRIKNVHF